MPKFLLHQVYEMSEKKSRRKNLLCPDTVSKVMNRRKKREKQKINCATSLLVGIALFDRHIPEIISN